MGPIRFSQRGLAAWVLIACAASSGTALGAPKVDPRADKVLRAMSQFYAAAPAISVRLEDEKKAQPVEQRQMCLDPPWCSMSVKFARPNRVSCKMVEGRTLAMTRVTDGRQLTLYAPSYNKYVKSPAPAEVGEALGFFDSPWLHSLSPTMGQGLDLAATLLNPKPYETLLDSIEEIRYVGEEPFGEGRAHRLKLLDQSADAMTHDIWIDAGREPIVRRLQYFYHHIKLDDGSPLTATTELNGWDFAAKLTDADFRFPLPEGAKPSNGESLSRLYDEDPNGLVGKPARAVDLKLLDGKTVKLADHIGKDVVVLYFWETWEPNHKYNYEQTLPDAAAVAAEFRERGCAFYAVNYKQEADPIRAFLKEHKFAFPVAVDRGDDVRAAFAVDDLPTTIVIGKDGTIEVVNVHRNFIGRTPEIVFRDLLRGELAEVFAGRRPPKP